MPLANLALTNTFDEWRIRTNQLVTEVNDINANSIATFVSNNAGLRITTSPIRKGNIYFQLNVSTVTSDTSSINLASSLSVNLVSNVASYASANASNAYDKANAANVLAFNTGIGANAYATAAAAGANTYLLATLAGANTAVGTGANAFAVATFSSANTIPVGNTIGSTYTLRSTRKSMNFIPGNNISINVDDDSSGDRANVTITAVAGSLQGANLTTQIITANTVTAVKDFRYILSNTTFTTLTLPGSPTLGDTIYIVIANGLANNIVARNGNRIMGLAEDLTIDIANIALGLVYADTNLGWRIT